MCVTERDHVLYIYQKYVTFTSMSNLSEHETSVRTISVSVSVTETFTSSPTASLTQTVGAATVKSLISVSTT